MFEGTVFARLDERLQRAISEAGYKTPTPIQEKAVPLLCGGGDLIGCAQTGTGKTAAFMLPILDRLLKVRKPRRIGHPRALVLSPTRELAVQTAENVKAYSAHCDLPFACIIGGVSQHGQVKDVKKGAETVIACPGRLIDLMSQGILFLDQVECFVLDEADRMLDMGFLPDIRRIISKLPARRQSLFFSATMPREAEKLALEMTRDAARVSVSPEKPTVEKIEQSAMLVGRKSKDALLMHLLAKHPEWTKVIVFAKMRHAADRVCKKLRKAGVECAAIHSDKTQNQRQRAIESFKSGATRVLVATDIASRGIDVPSVSCVVNLDLPLESESYVHRIGRTARAGESGKAVSFVSRDDMARLKDIERLIRKTIRIDREGNPFHGEGEESPADDGGRRGDKHWTHPANRNRTNRKRNGAKSGKGARQSDFGRSQLPDGL